MHFVDVLDTLVALRSSFQCRPFSSVCAAFIIYYKTPKMVVQWHSHKCAIWIVFFFFSLLLLVRSHCNKLLYFDRTVYGRSDRFRLLLSTIESKMIQKLIFHKKSLSMFFQIVYLRIWSMHLSSTASDRSLVTTELWFIYEFVLNFDTKRVHDVRCEMTILLCNCIKCEMHLILAAKIFHSYSGRLWGKCVR